MSPITANSPLLGPMTTGSHSHVRVAWDGKENHPSMRVVAASSQELKTLSLERGAIIFTEYLTYDKDTPEQMTAFVQLYPWVLEEPVVCNAIVGNPKCYNALREMGWWNTALANVNHPGNITDLWLKQSHVQALAYHASDAELSDIIDWPAWEMLVQEHGAMHALNNDASPFARAQAFVVLANRLGVELAPLMCAAMHVLLPVDILNEMVGHKWTPLQKAQYSWLLEKTEFVGDIWPTTSHVKQELRQAHDDLVSWQQLVAPQELASLAIVYELNNANLDDTIFELIQLVQNKTSTDTLDYTHALNDGSSSGPAQA